MLGIVLSIANRSPQQILVRLLNASNRYDVDDFRAGFESYPWKDILSEANRLGVLPILYYRLQNVGLLAKCPERFLVLCKDVWRQTTLTNMCLLHAFSQIGALFQAAGIPIVALKGIYLAHHVYAHSGMRQMGDIDLLVAENDLPRARQILLDYGYSQGIEDTYDEIKAEVEIAHHLAPFVKEGYPVIELHWHVVKPGEGWYIFPAEELWSRTVACAIGNASTLVLNREALFLHLCMHAAYHHLFAFGLRPLYDLHTLLSRFGHEMDWGEAATCADAWQVRNGVHLALAVVRRLFATPIPSQFREATAIPDEMIDLVIEQIFDEQSDSHNLTLLAKLYGSSIPQEGLQATLQRVFVNPHSVLSLDYLRFFFTRATRLFALYKTDLLRLYGPRRDTGLVKQARRYARIRRWLG